MANWFSYDMRIPYPQNPTSSSGGNMLRAEAGLNYPSRPQLDRKMMNTHEWMKNHRFMNVAQEHCRPGSAVRDFRYFFQLLVCESSKKFLRGWVL